MTDATPATLPSKCTAAKRKAAGKFAAAELGCLAVAAKSGMPIDAECIGKAEAKFTGTLAKAGTCADGGSSQTLVKGACVDTAGVGLCQQGTQTCNSDGSAFDPACVGEVTPGVEIECNSIDEDCSGSDLCTANGSSQARAGTSCRTIHAIDGLLPDGAYWIDPNGGATTTRSG